MKRTLLFIMLIALFSTYAQAQSPSITESAGWLESAYVKWSPVSGADSYNVYYSGNGISNAKIDGQLIRSYGSYFRADVLGLSAGTYTIKIVPVISGSEGSASTTGNLTVQAHDRTGFAFSNNRVPGAYNANGTPKSNAVILYITQETKDIVSLDVTGASANPCVGLQEILLGYKKGQDTRPLIIRLVGEITDLSVMEKGDIVIENNNNASGYITLEGVGDDAVANGWGIRVKNASNVEIKNVGTMNCNSSEGDNIGLQQNNDYIWIHHCDFFYGDAGGDSDQAKGDGALDCKKSTYVTFSYNHFFDSGKSNLLGLSEGTTTGLYITYHHNWYDHSDSRHPRVRFYSAHVYNNYYDGNAKYGVGSTEGSSVFVENNYFRNCKYPILTSMQGTDVYDESEGSNDYSDMPTFSKEDGGSIKAYNNYMTGQKRFVPYNASGYPSSTVDFDAYVASSRNETINSSIVSAYGNNSYNNFDTDASIIYSYTPDSPENARTKVMQYAGRMNGGDFNWTFDNSVDDAHSDLNTALKSAVVNYTTSLVFVQGEDETEPTTYTLSTGTSGSGSVSGAGTYNKGTTATITAIPASGWSFNNWSGDASGSNNPVIVTMNSNKSVTAVFMEGNPVTYTVSTSVSGSGTVSGAGTYNEGATATLTASAASGWSFSNWSGDASGSTNPLSFTVNSNQSVSAVFTENDPDEVGDVDHNFTLSGKSSDFFDITGNLSTSKGTVTYAGLTLTQCLKIESSTSISFTTTQESTLTLVFNDDFSDAIKIDGNSYDASSGTLTTTLSAGNHEITKGNSTNLYYISITYDGTEPVTYTLSTNVNGLGSVSGAGTYDEGEVVPLNAIANSGWEFSSWSGVDASNGTSATVTMNSNISVTANFSELIIEPDTYTLTAIANPSAGGSVSGSGIYNDGTEVNPTATANNGWQFDGWSNGSTNFTTTVIVDENKTITANFSELTTDPGTISLSASAGDSQVSLSWSSTNITNNFEVYRDTDSDPSGRVRISTGSNSVTTYTDSDVSNGTTYYYWIKSVDVSGEDVNSNAVSATPSGQGIEITIQETETGFCSVDGGINSNNSGFTGDGFANTDNASGNGVDYKISVGSAGTYTIEIQYANGSSDRPADIILNGSTLTAISMPGTGSWTSWTSVSTSISLTAGTSDLRLEATTSGGLGNIDYIKLSGANVSAASCTDEPVTYTLSTNVIGTGSVSGAGTYEEGEVVTLTASLSSGYEVNNWSGVDDSNGNTATVTMNSNRSVTVTITDIPLPYYELSTTINGQGSVDPSTGTYPINWTVEMTATPADGWKFDSWSGVDVNNGTSATVDMNSDRSVTANFSEIDLLPINTITLQENETGYCSVDGSVDDNNSGFTGDGFANTSNALGNGVEWSVDFGASETYTFTFRYASATDRPANLIVNGNTVASGIDFPATGGWTSWSTITTTANVSAGSHVVRLEATGSSGLGNIDYITIEGIGVAAYECSSLKSATSGFAQQTDNVENNLVVYPNPSNGLASVRFNLENASEVSVELYDVTGKLIEVISNSAFEAGENVVQLNNTELKSGLYILSIRTDTYVENTRLIIK